MKDSGLKSGSREMCLSQSLKLSISGLKFWLKKEFISRKFEFLRKIKGCQRELAAMMRGSNMGILPYWLIISLVTWGLPAH
jgi:hypothetical protein